MRILKNIHLISIDFVNVYLVERGDKLVLIDCALEGSSDKIFSYIESIGRSPEDISVIIITHRHRDHTGALGEILNKVRTKVAAHKLEAEKIDANVDILLNDNDVLEGLRVVHTPGHTPGHICLLDEETKALFVGDLIYEEKGELLEIPHKYSDDPMGNREAIKKLAELDFKHILPSHGKPILDRGKEALLELIKKLE
ncbi:MAG: MBL fold metallo-hydrolase [Candidatus Njordarchaeales archaeon]